MKKITALLMALLVVIGATAMFASADDVTFTVADLSAKAGAEIEVPITMSENSSAYCCEFELTYDASVLEFVKATNGSVFGNGAFNGDTAGVVKAAYAGSDAVTKGGAIATITFKVKGAAGATAQFGLNVTLLSTMDDEYNEVALTSKVTAGKLTVVGDDVVTTTTGTPNGETTTAAPVDTGSVLPVAVFGLVLVSGAALVALKKRG